MRLGCCGLQTTAGTDAAALIDARLDFAARVAAHERILQGVRTEVVSQEDLAGYWGVGKNKTCSILERVPGAEKVAGGWQIPMHRVPASYHVASGLLARPARDAA